LVYRRPKDQETFPSRRILIFTAIRCDHCEETDVLTAFARVTQETQGIDILVNNVWGGYARMIDNGVFTWS
jgi:NAD(P)-dependent dehydrogenase (short-subunit alcohol dehydrogenase family)